MDPAQTISSEITHWQSISEVQDVIEKSPQYETLLDAFALGAILCNALPISGYVASEEWVKAVSLSSNGQSCLKLAEPKLVGISKADLNQAIFAIFAHRSLLIDLEKTDIQAIRSLIQKDVLEARMRIPPIYGRLLYDKYNDSMRSDKSGVDHLTSDEVDRLIQDAPIGVYQIGRTLVGPLGILESSQSRMIVPNRYVPLWHCPDTGCRAVHPVELLPHETGTVRAMREIPRITREQLGPASEWDSALFLQSFRGRRPQTDKSYVDIGHFFMEQVIGPERIAIAIRAFAGSSAKRLREIIGTPPRKKSQAAGSSAEICSRLSEHELLQLLLTLADDELVRLLDSSVWNKEINVPVTEVRRSVIKPSTSAISDSNCELSSLGIRSATNEPVSVLSSIVLTAYAETKLEHDLSWRLREFANLPQTGALFEYTRRHGPSETISELVLSNRGVADHVCRKLNLPIDGLSKLTNNQSAELIAWKMGFDMPRHDDSHQRFLRRLTQFNEQVLAIGVILSEDDRERARSAGVNPFVSLERLLEGLVSFNVWLLASDHFLQTRLTYDSCDALTMVAKVLGGTLESAGQTFAWRTEGQNTLGVTLRYMDEMITWVQSLPTKDRSLIERKKDEVPFYATRPYIEFPFRHTELWADSDASTLAHYSAELTTVCRLISQSQPAGVRNALDHDRKDADFPSAETLLACAARLRDAAERADVLRLIARPYWLRQIRQDNSGIVENIFQDYAGRTVSIYEPSGIRPEIVYDFVQPIIIAPFNFIGRPNSMLCFRIREDSISARYWRDFPRLKQANGVEDQAGPLPAGDSSIPAQ